MSSSDSETKSSTSQMEATPGAFPPTPEPESPVLVSSQLSLSQAVYKRREEYTVQKRTKVKVGTWNVAALSGTEKDIKGWFVDGKGISEHLSGLTLERQKKSAEGINNVESVEDQEERRSKKRPTVPKNDPGLVPGGKAIGLYVLGLQEIVNVASTTEALRPFNDPHPARKWKQAVVEALPSGYELVAEQQLIGLFLLVYASPTIMPSISHISTTSVGTGLLGYLGNKGAVTARIVLGETTRIVFINCHLGAGVEKGALERRNWDASQILGKTKFDPIIEDGGINDGHQETIGEEDFAFWFGDLNYRLEGLPGEDVRRLLMLHTKGEYGHNCTSQAKIACELDTAKSAATKSDVEAMRQPIKDDITSIPDAAETFHNEAITSASSHTDSQNVDLSSDATTLQATLTPLLAHDQLLAQIRQQKAFHDGWREGDVTFLPTYKYDVGSIGMFDSSDKRRGPSWCDRILFRTRRDKSNYEEQVRNEAESKKKDNEMKLRGVVETATAEAVLFDYDPETDGADNEIDESSANLETVPTKAGFEDKLHLDYYTSHQRVLSSDHKPLDAVFTIDYDAVDPEQKARVYQEVARELDKAENEGRPVVTVVVDRHRNIATPLGQASDQESVDFGDVKYDHIKKHSITIANTGRVPATVGFVDRSAITGEPDSVAPPWLTIRFDRPSDNKNPNPGALQDYTLEPGDAINVELSINVTDSHLARRLNSGVETLDDVLILRIQNGRDYFIPLHGDWQQSAFGRSIEKLIRLPEGGVRKLQHQHPEGSSPGHDAVKWSVPRELFRLTDATEKLVERAVGEWEMRGEQDEPPWIHQMGWPFSGWTVEKGQRKMLKRIVMEGLDCDTPFEDYWPADTTSIQRLEAVADTLLDFLNSLEDGVITETLWTELESGMIEREKLKKTHARQEEQAWILDIFSAAPPHSVAFTFLTFMLTNIVSEIAPLTKSDLPASPSSSTTTSSQGPQNQTGAYALRRRVIAAYTSIFAAAMIRLPKDSKGKAKRASEGRRHHVLEVFLPPQDE